MKISKKGFTLVELMVVVAIVGILAAIAIPGFMNYRTKAFNAEAKSDLRVIRTALELLAIDTAQWPEHTQPYAPGTGLEVEDLNPATVGLVNTDGNFPNWNGPYLQPGNLTDPWGNNYWFDQDYYVDGIKVMALGSYGPNGVGKNLYDEDDVYLVIPPS